MRRSSPLWLNNGGEIVLVSSLIVAAITEHQSIGSSLSLERGIVGSRVWVMFGSGLHPAFAGPSLVWVNAGR